MASTQFRAHPGGMNTAAQQSEQDRTTDSRDAADGSSQHGHDLPLYRPTHDRMVAGVASGIARYLGVEVMLVRIALVVLCFVGGIAVPFYLASWLLIPEEGADQSIAADFIRSMQGWRD
jgi:phage shock protein PspC (stress-responsive transcriptional regulator)